MIRKNLQKISILVLLILINGCKDITDQDKYQRPEWLEGKLYTQIAAEEDLGLFTECLELTGFDTVLNVSGSYTVFAPHDEAFTRFFQENPQYDGTVSSIPKEQLTRIVKYHIIQNSWSREQLQSLDIYGWIDKDDPDNDKPKGYKRQTLLKDDNKKYWVKTDRDKTVIVDSLESNGYRKVFTRSRKYAPLFFNDYFPINDLSFSDYEFYFNRPYESGNIYYAEAKILGEEVFAENGFIHKVDRVVQPRLNAEQLLEQEDPIASYKSFLGLIQQFPDFSMNLEESYKQPEARAGEQFDTLYNMNYNEIMYNLHDELTGPNTNISNYTTRYQNALLAPTDQAFQKFINEVLTASSGYPRWSSYNAVPLEIKKIIANTHLATSPVYETNIIEGFENGAGDIVRIDESDIIKKYYGSNCTFLGLDEVIIPRAFSSVSGPVYLRPGYSVFMYAMEYTKILPAIKDQNAEYALYVIPDLVMQADSSLEVIWDDVVANRYRFRSFNRSIERFEVQARNHLARRLMNQVGTTLPTGIPRKEFIENLAGNYILVNNEENTVQGGGATVFGYMGDSAIKVYPQLIDEPTDNGQTYSVNTWITPPSSDMYSRLTSYSKLLELMTKSGLYNPKTYSFTFLTSGEYYTIFVPSEQALIDYGADDLTTDELSSLIKYHFVKGEKIFTDGKQSSGFYETLRVDESSTQFSTRYSKLNIRTGIDIIEILDKNGNPYVTVHEDENATNLFIATDTDNISTSLMDYITTGVIHEIDQVLIKD
jgi:uncharacterized surface protein with fasciclin (FAS1) repeats